LTSRQRDQQRYLKERCSEERNWHLDEPREHPMTYSVADHDQHRRANGDGATERFGSGNRARLIVLYLLSLVPLILLLRLLLGFGGNLTGP
jgi:hypothetical protein